MALMVFHLLLLKGTEKEASSPPSKGSVISIQLVWFHGVFQELVYIALGPSLNRVAGSFWPDRRSFPRPEPQQNPFYSITIINYSAGLADT
jgi:hypothetical protein